MKKKPSQIDLAAIAVHAMEKYGFSARYPGSVMREATDAAGRSPHHIPGTRDMRDLLWSSIDNIDSGDLDQLEHCERLPDGRIHVFVAIADVDAYVPKGSATDRYAAHNGTSVYTGITTFPMLPDVLSKGITSLLPEQDRLAIVSEYTVLFNGELQFGGIFPALVRNKAKLVYEETGDWLAGNGELPARIRDTPGLEAQVRLQHELSLRLRKERMQQGALDLETLEASPVIEDGVVKDLIVVAPNPARIIIEELMVAANRTMIAALENAGLPVIERVVRTPKNWEGIVETAKALGERLPKTPDAKALSAFLTKRKTADPERFPDLSLTVVKLMGPGEYMMLPPGGDPYGHFALAVTDYTHATAPNRRYPDLINQRLIKSVIRHEPPPYTPEELKSLAEHLTDREKAGKKVERFMGKAAAAVLLRDRIGDVFNGIVTGAAEKGTYVRVIVPPAEGRVVEGERGLFVGQKVRVRLLSVDAYRAFIDFAFVEKR
ncbi:MAG: exoribonuclease R [Methanoregula sp. PtaU1.Bin051]|nr:MAG: exoribonuclease R [Methanoregula sp. PtaU1.Bin051]